MKKDSKKKQLLTAIAAAAVHAELGVIDGAVLRLRRRLRLALRGLPGVDHLHRHAHGLH